MATGVITMPVAVEKILSAGIVTVISRVWWSTDEVREGFVSAAVGNGRAVFEFAEVGDDRTCPKSGLCSIFGSLGRFDAEGMIVLSFG
jgi:hypothetical protein